MPNTPDKQLLTTATLLTGTLHLDELVVALHASLKHLPHLTLTGLAVHDDDRQIIRTISTTDIQPDQPTVAADQIPLNENDPFFSSTQTEFASTVIAPPTDDEFPQSLVRFKVRRFATIPIHLNDRWLGHLYVGFDAPDKLPDETVAHLTRLANLTTPVFFNCLITERLTRGDHLRDTLIDFANVINASLEPTHVIQSAHRVINRLADLHTTAINLLNPDEQTYTSYQHESPVTPTIIPIADTPMSWIIENEKTYISDDLTTTSTFPDDDRLIAAGIRRYVLAPMIVRDRLIGGLFIATTNPTPIRKIDIWSYESIAVQLGLAIANATQVEKLKQLSERLKQQNVYLREEIRTEQRTGEMIGLSKPIRFVQDDIAKVAPTDARVLITGETGVGKELVARAIHAHSPRTDQPMVKVNCAAIPESMVESELFGHEKGAFTSAHQRRIGRFELARDGTLFLDEVGELSLTVQTKLLRVLQDGEFERVGGSETINSNARIIAATNRDLRHAVQNKSFRSDLYFRLNVFPIHVPPLRERREDIPLLANAFVAEFARKTGKPIDHIEPESLAYLLTCTWPGNIRELRHVIERAMILADGPVLTIEQSASPSLTPMTDPIEDEAFPTLQSNEADHIRQALHRTGGKIEGPNGAAQLLGLKPSTLRHRINRLGIKKE